MKNSTAPNRKTGRMIAKNLIVLFTVALAGFCGIQAWFTDKNSVDANGNSTYDDVYAELGEPMYNNITHGDVTYKRKDGYVTFTFDDNMNLTNFVYCIEDTH